MAVCAEQNALTRLLACSGQRPGDAARTQREALVSSVEVMELQRRDATVIATQHAPAASLRHEDSLDLPPPPRHRLRVASGASITRPYRSRERSSNRVVSSGVSSLASQHVAPVAARPRPSSGRTRAASASHTPCYARRPRRSARSTSLPRLATRAAVAQAAPSAHGYPHARRAGRGASASRKPSLHAAQPASRSRPATALHPTSAPRRRDPCTALSSGLGTQLFGHAAVGGTSPVERPCPTPCPPSPPAPARTPGRSRV